MPLITKHFGSLEYLTAENISVPHAFTTRRGGVSTGYLDSLNIGAHRGDSMENVAENYRILARALGFSCEKLVLSHQVHTDTVRAVTEHDCLGSFDHHDYPECDALITNTPGVALTVFSADCTPILLHDPVTGAVGAVHAGWRGTALGIAAGTVAAMVREYGCDPTQICAAVGPNIGPCCFATDADVPDAMGDALGAEAAPYITGTKGKFHVDLKGLNALWLRKCGLSHIKIATQCTACEHDRFWSHRVTGGERGSQGAIILRKESHA